MYTKYNYINNYFLMDDFIKAIKKDPKFVII